jgi:hypothetical protein
MSRKSLRPQLHKYKGDQCAYCGKTVQEMQDEFIAFGGYFHFNHVDPSTKAENYDNIIRRTRLSSEILDEVDKCVLLCTACHTILHGQGITEKTRMRPPGKLSPGSSFLGEAPSDYALIGVRSRFRQRPRL